jgi:hypothetical protein
VTVRSICVALALAIMALATASDYTSAKRKFDLIDSDRSRPGTRVELTTPELNAYIEHETPVGVHHPKLEVVSPGVTTGTAMIDFGQIRRAQGYAPGWLMSKLLDGERPVSVTAQITSAHGQATVKVQRVVVSGIEIDGATLDFLIKNFLLAMYPDAAVDRPFALGHRIERLDIQPAAVGVIIGK